MRCCVSRALTSLAATDPARSVSVARAAHRRGPPLSLIVLALAAGCGGSDEPKRPPVRADLRAHTATAPARDRAAILGSAERAITLDARRRARSGELKSRTRRTSCKPRKGQDPAGDAVVYECLAVTFEVKATIGAPPLASGYPFQLRVEYPKRRFGWCKIEPVGGEGARQSADRFVEPDEACGGLGD